MDANRTGNDLLLLGLVCGLAFFSFLGGPLLWDRDEPRNAGCAREMLQRGDWTVPTFNQELRSQKPALLYWLIMSAYTTLGISEFSARVWSAILGSVTVLLTYWAGRKLFDATVGFWSAVILGTSAMFVVASRAATPDAALICFTSAALLWFAVVQKSRLDVHLHQPEIANDITARTHSIASNSCFPHIAQAILFYALLGLAVLAKGPAGFLIPMFVVGGWSLWNRLPTSDRSRHIGLVTRLIVEAGRILNPRHIAATVFALRPLLGCCVVLILAAPWYIAVGVKTDMQFLAEFLWRENVARATTTFENHSGGWWFYPLALLVGFFPWSAFAVPVVGEVDRRLGAQRDPLLVFLVIWVAVQVGIFSLAKTKLPSYVTPCYPALALVAGWALVRWQRGEQKVIQRFYVWGTGAIALVGVVLSAGLAWAAQKYLNGALWLAFVGAPLIFGGYWGWRVCHRHTADGDTETPHVSKRPDRWLPQSPLGVLGVSSVVFVVALFGWGATEIGSTRTNNSVIEAIRQSPPETLIYAYCCLESSWIYYGEKPIVELLMDSQSTDTGENDDATIRPAARRISPEALTEHRQPVLIVTTDRHLEEVLTRLGGQFEIAATAPYFTRTERMVLLARKSNRTAAEIDPANHVR